MIKSLLWFDFGIFGEKKVILGPGLVMKSGFHWNLSKEESGYICLIPAIGLGKSFRLM